HSTLRRLVMGESAVGEEASPAHLDAMVELLHHSLDEGALGFSSSLGSAHMDHRGDPVPSRFASREEFLALSEALRPHEGMWLEFIPSIEKMFELDKQELMADMSVAAGGRSLNWNVLTVRPGADEADSRVNRLSSSDIAAARGGKVVGLTMPGVGT